MKTAYFSKPAVCFYLGTIWALLLSQHQCQVANAFSISRSSFVRTESPSSSSLLATRSVGSPIPTTPRADDLIQDLWGKKSNDDSNGIDAIVSACSDTVVWEDMRLKNKANGPQEVSKLLKAQLPGGTSNIVVDKVADGAASAGFTWTRVDDKFNDDPKLGLRGTTYIELDSDGKINCVKELAEPLYKPGDMMLKLLQAATKNVERPVKNPTYEQETPTSCSEIVDYIWNRAYPKDAPVEEAVRFYSNDIVYQDFNYPLPIRGVKDVETFSREWGDFPGIDFRIQDLSEGDTSCCFTWRVKVNGKEGPQGVSFYETDGNGKITYIRDTPSPTFRPVFGKLARLLRPKLRTFRSRKDMVDGIPIDETKE